jgi:hypothetical protein
MHRVPRNGPISAYISLNVAPRVLAREPQSRGGRLDTVMNTDNRFFGMIIGGIVVVAVAIFIFSGGELGGKKTIEGDDDLPPIATTDK